MYIFTDIDNTLNEKNKTRKEEINPCIKSLFYKLIKKIKIGVATTRGFFRAQKLMKKCLNSYYVTLNGGEIYDNKGNFIIGFPLSKKEKNEIINIIKVNHNNIKLLAYYYFAQKYGKVYIKTNKKEEIEKFFENYYYTFKNKKDITNNIDIFLDSFLKNELSMIEIIVKNSKILKKIKIPFLLNWCIDKNCIFINHRKIDKGYALKKLIKLKKIKLKKEDDLILIGDSITDVKMVNKFKNAKKILVNNKQYLKYFNFFVKNPKELCSFLNNFFMIQK